LNRSGLGPVPEDPFELVYRADRIVGLRRGEPDAFFFPVDLPQEQTFDDERSMTFDSAPLQADVDVVGMPVLRVRVSADVPVAKLAVRLNEVTPHGASWLISSGILNLTHRTSHENPEPLEPGCAYDVDVPLFFTAKSFKRGNRIRVALSESFWPLLWPSPQIATLTVTTGLSSLTLPVRPRNLSEAKFSIPLLSQGPGEQHPPTAAGCLEVVDSGPDGQHCVLREKAWELARGTVPELGTELTAGWTPAILRMNEGDPNSCTWAGGSLFRAERGCWDVAVTGAFEVTSTPEAFHIKETIQAREEQVPIFERSWSHTLKRDLM
jgi:hypothetical protein